MLHSLPARADAGLLDEVAPEDIAHLREPITAITMDIHR
jgi:hypothetical protein